MTRGAWASDRIDPYDLNRFISAQEGVYDRALAELREGLKRSHWMWYIFPQIEGLGIAPRHSSIPSKAWKRRGSILPTPFSERASKCARKLSWRFRDALLQTYSATPTTGSCNRP